MGLVPASLAHLVEEAPRTMHLAFMFPGQGAQKPGMGQALYDAFPEARTVFERANEVLSFDLASLCFAGPAEKLTSTDIAQPAILTVSIATLHVLQAHGLPAPTVALGHSLGEYSALVAAGSFSFETALLLVRKRGLFMREAGAQMGGGMAAVIGADDEALASLIEEVRGGRILVAANYNAPDQTVISGEQSAVADAGAALKERGLGRYIPLRVSGAFHSPLMAPAAERMAAELDAAEILDAQVPVIPNATAVPTQSAAAIRQALKDQVTSSVRWTSSVAQLRGLGCTAAIEIGARGILGPMVEKIDSGLAALSAHDVDSVRECLERLEAIR